MQIYIDLYLPFILLVAKENEDTQKIKIVVGVCVSVVMFGIVWVLACYM